MRVSFVGAALSAVALLSSCGSTANNADTGGAVRLGLSGTPQVSAPAGVTIVSGLPPAGVGVTDVTGVSCKNKMWDQDPSRDNAVAMMLRDAAQKGLTNVASVTVEAAPNPVLMNCWAALIAKGKAYK